MIDQAQLIALLKGHGAYILTPLAVIEGPVVTVIAGWLASIGVINLAKAYVLVVVADLVGDSILYLLGRYAPLALPQSWRNRIGASPRNLVRLRQSFRDTGPKILMIGKITHAAGFAALFAAGTARMRFGTFLLFNLLATLPKSAAFLALGYLVGTAVTNAGDWISALSAVGLAVAGLILWRYLRQRETLSS